MEMMTRLQRLLPSSTSPRQTGGGPKAAIRHPLAGEQRPEITPPLAQARAGSIYRTHRLLYLFHEEKRVRKPLSEAFFLRQAFEIAPKLIGMRLTTRRAGKETSGMIVEVEAYHQEGDRASHSYPGKTARNASMFLPGGHCYVYLVYGVHHCVNVVTGPLGTGEAVLIRAIEPLSGIALMQRRRGTPDRRALTNGPGKLCQALGITPRLDGEPILTSKDIRLSPYRVFPKREIVQTTRIGISKATYLPWRFYLRGNLWVSA